MSQAGVKGYIVDARSEPRRKPRPERPPPPVPTDQEVLPDITESPEVVPVSRTVVKPVAEEGQPSPQPPVDQTTTSTRRRRCAVNTKLLPLKIVIFLMYGGMAALYPFFTLHMKSLGMTIKETAVISFLLPILSCLAVPLIGGLADRIGHYKWLIVGLTAGHIFCHLLLLGIPGFTTFDVLDARPTPSVDITLPCRTRENAIFTVTDQPPFLEASTCDPTNLTATAESRNELQIDGCRTDCPVAGVRLSEQPSVCFLNATGGGGDYCPKWADLEGQMLRGLVLVSHTPVVEGGPRPSVGEWETAAFRDDEGSLLRSAHCYVGPKWEASSEQERPDCSISCSATTSFSMVCRVAVHREGSFWLTIVAYFFLRLLGLTGLLSVYVILDTVTLQLTHEHGATFGAHRLFSALAYVIFPVVSGLWMGGGWVAGGWRQASVARDFYPAFVLFGALNAAAALVVLCMRTPVNTPQTSVWRNVGRVLRSPVVIAVIVVVMLIGMAIGYFTCFLFWFLEAELSMPKTMMGVGAALSNLIAIPFFLAAHRLIPVLGHANLLVIVLLCSGARFLLYANLFNPNYYLPIEIFTGITVAIIYTIPADFSHLMAPAYVSTLQALLLASCFGLGAGLGPLIGGELIAGYGHRITMRIFAVAFLIVAVIYLLLHLLFLRKIKPLPAPVLEAVSSPIAKLESPPRNSDMFPEEEVILYRESASPLAEVDSGFVDPIYVYGSRPVSELVVVYR